MIQVDFYLLDGAFENERTQNSVHYLACRLVEKAYFKQHRVFIQCNDKHHAEAIDDLLWSFKEESFIPHNIQGEGPIPPPPIQIGYTDNASGFNDILVNLANTIPPHHQQFKRIIEVVGLEEQQKEVLRDHYRFYKQAAYPINTHKLAEDTVHG